MGKSTLCRCLLRVIMVMMALLIVVPAAEAQRQKRTTKSTQVTKRTRKSSKVRSMELVKKDKNTTQRRISETTTKIKKLCMKLSEV